MPDGGLQMAYSRPMVFVGTDDNGNRKYKRVSGNTQDEVNDAIVKVYVECGRIWDFLPVEFIQQLLIKCGNELTMVSISRKHSFF